MKVIALISALCFVGCVSPPEVPVKRPHRGSLRNFTLESGHCPSHQNIYFPKRNGYAVNPILNPEEYRKVPVENFR